MDDLTVKLTKALYDILFELHPVHPNTAFHSASGVGGQALTLCCHVLDRNASDNEVEILLRAEDVLREAMRVLEKA